MWFPVCVCACVRVCVCVCVELGIHVAGGMGASGLVHRVSYFVWQGLAGEGEEGEGG